MKHKHVRAFAAIAVVGVALVMLSCAPAAQVNQDFDPDVDFPSFATFDWLPEVVRRTAEEATSEQMVYTLDALREAIESHLMAKGLKWVSDGPALLVGYRLGVKSDINAVDWDTDYRGEIEQGDTYRPEGDLIIIDLIDAESNHLVWRGHGHYAIDVDPSRQNIQRTVGQAVAKILAQYPPEKAGR